MKLNRHEALNRIDDVREALSLDDYNRLSGIVRDLYDGYPIADAQGAASRLVLSDYDAERAVKAMVAAIEE